MVLDKVFYEIIAARCLGEFITLRVGDGLMIGVREVLQGRDVSDEF
jgi:hypothetical protein